MDHNKILCMVEQAVQSTVRTFQLFVCICERYQRKGMNQVGVCGGADNTHKTQTYLSVVCMYMN